MQSQESENEEQEKIDKARFKIDKKKIENCSIEACENND